MSEDPTPGELARRQADLVAEMRNGFKSIGERLDRMPTNELLLAHMATWDTQLRGVREDVDEIKAVHVKDVVDLSATIKGLRTETDAKFETQRKEGVSTRRWAIGTAIAAASILIGIAGFVLAVMNP